MLNCCGIKRDVFWSVGNERKQILQMCSKPNNLFNYKGPTKNHEPQTMECAEGLKECDFVPV